MRSDEELMVAYRQGDEAAFRELFDRHRPRLLRLFRRAVRSEDDARELLQQTFLQLHRAREDFRSDMPLRPWMTTIALNLRRGHIRRQSRTRHHSRLPVRRSTPPEAPRALLIQHIRRALEDLPVKQREVIELYWFGGLGFVEIAERLGSTHVAVKLRAHRGYERLRELLRDEA